MKGFILYDKKLSELTENDHGPLKLMEEAQKKGIDLSVYSPDQFELIVSRSDRKSLYVDGYSTALPDFCMPRTGSKTTYFSLAVMRQMENLDVYTCNKSAAVECVKDKLHIHQLLAQSDLPTPKTMLLKFPVDIELVKRVIGFPLVVKNISGQEGKGVYLCETATRFGDLMDLMYSYKKNMNIIIQEFVSGSRGKDLRVFILGNKVVGCMKRMAQGDDFKANFSRGGLVEPFELNQEIERLALQTARMVGLEIAGIDLLFDGDGYKVLEANSAPGFRGLEQATGKNIASEILDYIVEQLRRRKRIKV